MEQQEKEVKPSPKAAIQVGGRQRKGWGQKQDTTVEDYSASPRIERAKLVGSGPKKQQGVRVQRNISSALQSSSNDPIM